MQSGSHVITAKATDNQGASTSSTPVTVDMFAPPAGNVYYIHADHLNTPRVITDASNKVVWRWDSDPFGAEKANEDPDGDGAKFTYNLRFPGQYYDRETNLHYNYFRDYDPTTGRYVQSDPIGLEGGTIPMAMSRETQLPKLTRPGSVRSWVVGILPMQLFVLRRASLQVGLFAPLEQHRQKISAKMMIAIS